MELSLEEIIKLKKIGKSSKPQTKRLSTSTDRKPNNLKGRVNPNQASRQPLQGRLNSKPVDARLKIIQKNRQRMTDARDKLVEIAKKTDARTKIQGRKTKKRAGKNHHRSRFAARKRDIAELISQNKAIYVENKQQNGRQNQRSGTGFGQNQTTPSTPVLLQRSFKNNVAANMRDPSSLIRCTINRTASDFARLYGEDMDIDEPLPARSHDFSGIQVALRNEFMHYPRQEYMPNREPYMEPYEAQIYRTTEPRNLPRKAEPRRMSLEMRARLDTPARPQRPPSPSPPPPQPQGHRIVVSNLHSSVTHEDIKELFEDIGPLLTSRLVRAGTAEVIYKFQKDAQKAVEAYHNRQLDGQPMKCLLVNARPSSSSASGVLRSSNMPAPPKFPSSSKSMVIPDLSAIHKALFTSK